MTTAAMVNYASTRSTRRGRNYLPSSRLGFSPMFGGLFFIGFGLAMVALVIFRRSQASTTPSTPG